MSTYNMKTRTISNEQSPSGVKGQISFHRLTDMFRQTGEIMKDETVTHFEMRGDFLVYSVEYNR